MIGNDVPALVRTARFLQTLPIAAVDLNLGCPAPIVYRKCAGGGLLRELPRIDAILGALRDAVSIPFTVKTRVGFASIEEFEALLPIFARHATRRPDGARAHGGADVPPAGALRPDPRRPSASMPCPVIANGDVHSPAQALELAGADRRPRPDDRARRDPQSVAVRADPAGAARRGRHPADRPRRVDLHPRPVGSRRRPSTSRRQVQCDRMKKFLNFVGEGVPAPFLHDIRRATRRPSSTASAPRSSTTTSR